jgi:biopolymer transport protein ExbB/TolQ
MRKQFPVEFVYQVFALLISVVLVHAIYTALIRPQARAFLDELAVKVAAETGTGHYVAIEPNFFVIIKGPEQELAIIFAIWAFAIMGYKFRNVALERRMFDTEMVSVAEGESILPEDARSHARAIESLPADRRDRLLPRLYQNALNRFRITRSVQDASEEARRQAESVNDRLDAELAIIRYICWAIPSIGFVGTVRGIGNSLGHAQAVLQGDMTGVTEALGVAFNSTLVALLLSLITVFLLYQLQLIQERLVLDAHQDCERKLIQNLQAPV